MGTFNANGAAKATRSCTDTTTASSGSCTVTAYTLTSSDYDSTKYNFNGWDKVTTDGTKDADAEATITLTGNVTYEAMLSIKDQSCPAITFSTNGNTTYSTSHSTTVTVTDNSGVAEMKYLWSTSSSSSASSGTSFTSGSTITNSTGTGTYYLCVYAKDNAGNSCNQCSSAFYLDNTAPTCTITPTYDGSSYVIVTLNANDTSTMSYYILNEWQDSNSRYLADNRALEPKVKDAVGNETTCGSITTKKMYKKSYATVYCENDDTGASTTRYFYSGSSYEYYSASAVISACKAVCTSYGDSYVSGCSSPYTSKLFIYSCQQADGTNCDPD